MHSTWEMATLCSAGPSRLPPSRNTFRQQRPSKLSLETTPVITGKHWKPTPQFAPELTTVYADLMHCEMAPKRRDPCTLLMLTELRSRVKEISPHPDSSMATLDDWFVCGTYAGFRLSEWAQEAKNSRMGSFQLDLRNEAKALCLRDVRFASNTGAWFYAVYALNAHSGTQFDKCWIVFALRRTGTIARKRCSPVTPRQEACALSHPC